MCKYNLYGSVNRSVGKPSHSNFARVLGRRGWLYLYCYIKTTFFTHNYNKLEYIFLRLKVHLLFIYNILNTRFQKLCVSIKYNITVQCNVNPTCTKK